jgi:hypothetical protein
MYCSSLYLSYMLYTIKLYASLICLKLFEKIYWKALVQHDINIIEMIKKIMAYYLAKWSILCLKIW